MASETSSGPSRYLLATGDPGLARRLAGAIRASHAGPVVITCAEVCGSQAAEPDPVDVVLIDAASSFPTSGWRWREQLDDAGVMVLTAGPEAQDRIVALNTGADDAMWRDGDEMELQARLRALWRRRARSTVRRRFGRFVYDPAGSTLMADGGGVIVLTPSLHRLMGLLLEAYPAFMSKAALSEAMHRRFGTAPPSPAYWNVAIYRLRAAMSKLVQGAETIQCRRHSGYRLVQNPKPGFTVSAGRP